MSAPSAARAAPPLTGAPIYKYPFASAAFAKARAAANERRRTRDLQDKINDRAAGLAACQAMRTTLVKTARGVYRPYTPVETVETVETEPDQFHNSTVSTPH